MHFAAVLGFSILAAPHPGRRGLRFIVTDEHGYRWFHSFIWIFNEFQSHMYIYMYIYTHTYVYIYIYAYISVYLSIYLNMNIQTLHSSHISLDAHCDFDFWGPDPEPSDHALLWFERVGYQDRLRQVSRHDDSATFPAGHRGPLDHSSRPRLGLRLAYLKHMAHGHWDAEHACAIHHNSPWFIMIHVLNLTFLYFHPLLC